MAMWNIATNVMRPMAREVARDVIRRITYETLIEAQFLKMFNHSFMPKQVRQVVNEALLDSFLRE